MFITVNFITCIIIISYELFPIADDFSVIRQQTAFDFFFVEKSEYIICTNLLFHYKTTNI